MNTIVLSRARIYSGKLLLVNADCPLRQAAAGGQIPADARTPAVLLQRDAAHVLRLIFEKISAGDAIVPVSGYRSAEEQTAIYADSMQRNGRDFTRKFVALPYHSEHQTGLAVDLGLRQEKLDFICPDFPATGICGTFRRLAPQYGFIERYPQGKERLTGIAYEPWHFRYVGYPHSEIMRENGLVLEEYMAFVKQYPRGGRHLLRCKAGRRIEIFYAAADETEIALPENAAYQISGNNTDGFIVTLWRRDNA